jgi:LmbE family N-acetylglucosaminyl deacetylase
MRPRSPLDLLPAGILLASIVVAAQVSAPWSGPGRGDDVLPIDRGAVGLWQALQRLHTRASVLHVIAHPDDEDGGMLTRESRGRGTRVDLLCLTRGEGGANVMSNDYFDALGLVRTEELVAAARHYGATPWFGTLADYGYSKTREECLGQWTHERALGDVVRAIRRTRPLVVTSVFGGTPADGHGNHQVTGQVTIEAFDAAGDPRRFPEHRAEGLRPWTALKLYVRAPRSSAPAAGAVTIPSGDYDPVLGLSYSQVARAGLDEHKSQNGGIGVSLPGPASSAYRRLASRVNAPDGETSLFDGIDTSLVGLAALAQPGQRQAVEHALRQLEGDVEEAVRQFTVERPDRCAPALARGLGHLETLAAEQSRQDAAGPGTEAASAWDRRADLLEELMVKREQFHHALALALGVSVTGVLVGDANAPSSFRLLQTTPAALGVPGPDGGLARARFRVSVTSGAGDEVRLESIEAGHHSVAEGAYAPELLRRNQTTSRTFVAELPPDTPVSRPAFRRSSIDQPYYEIDRRAGDIGLPTTTDPLEFRVRLSYHAAPFDVRRVVQAVSRVHGMGVVLQPVAAVPALSVSVEPRARVIDFASRSFQVVATIGGGTDAASAGLARLELPPGWTATPLSVSFSGATATHSVDIPFTVVPAALGSQPYTITAVAEFAGRQFREGYRIAGYAGRRPSYLFTPSTVRVSAADVKVAPGLSVGYVEGSGDAVGSCLRQMGVSLRVLSATDLAAGDLRSFDAIVLGVRAYAVRSDLIAANSRLLAYVKDGGTLIVQYNTPEFDHDYGPYPYTMGDEPEEVTDERSRVEILEPRHPAFAWPNAITTRDFDGWVEERGSKFLSSWDPRYVALLSTADAGQPAQKGGLLVSSYGKGVYVYAAYAFYRQLPEGVPGASRLFANLVSLGKNPARRVR